MKGQRHGYVWGYVVRCCGHSGRHVWSVGLGLLILLFPAASLAQTGIAGTVKDGTGAVLPGVTVEASSPVLIERVRTAVTDGDGVYKIVNLSPGEYTVTFTLQGFAPLKREGVRLTATFTATVDAELSVGAVNETITVAGQASAVDVQNVVLAKVVTREILDTLPTTKTAQTLGALIPGANAPADVGGTYGESQTGVAIHGGRASDMTSVMDGMAVQNAATKSQVSHFLNNGMIEEISFSTDATSAEVDSGGIRVNYIPKEGGNTLRGVIFGAFSNHSLQSSNVTPALQSQGLAGVSPLDKIWDVNPAVGGPLIRDRLWFYTAFRYWGAYRRSATVYYNVDPTAPVYRPDVSRGFALIAQDEHVDHSLRLTLRASERHKVHVYSTVMYNCLCTGGLSGTVAPEATTHGVLNPEYQIRLTWSAPVSNRLLLEAGGNVTRAHYHAEPNPEYETASRLSAVTELSTNFTSRAAPSYTSFFPNDLSNYRAAASYVTGSHNLKVGFTFAHGVAKTRTSANNDMSLQLNRGVPVSITIFATPYSQENALKAELGAFAQDQWKFGRMSLNYGVRFDYLHAHVPAQDQPAGQFVPARSFPAVPDVPNWKATSPRLGVSYDLLGNSRTALKASIGRYVTAFDLFTFTGAANPVSASINNTTRSWTDANGDFLPQPNELGPLAAANFGGLRAVSRYSTDVLGNRGFNWEGSVGVQHELRPGISVNVAYFRRWYGNFTGSIQNQAVSPQDYDPYCITAPVDAALPGGGGNEICGLYDISPARFGVIDNFVVQPDRDGKQYENWNGMDFTGSARVFGAVMSGGVSTGKTAFDNCDVQGQLDNAAGAAGYSGVAVVVPSPGVRFCHQETPFLTQVKVNGSYTMPWGIQVSAAFQNRPGPMILAQYLATTAQIAPSLGRNLAGGVQTALIDLVQPNTIYGERVNQTDLRMAKIINIGRTRVKGMVDLYNLFNANPVLTVNNRYAPGWPRPLSVLDGRLLKFAGQFDF